MTPRLNVCLIGMVLFVFAHQSHSAATPVSQDECKTTLSSLLQSNSHPLLEQTCSNSQVLPSCQSHENKPIFHWQSEASQTPPTRKKLKILVFGVIHGDEPESGALVHAWIDRLNRISPRNTWRLVPILNPDGMKLGTRTNSNSVDLNRNFPTQDWQEKAHHFWKVKAQTNPRRFPGKAAGSEKETQCAMKQIEDFKPDFVVAIHTPYGLIDFDGPNTPGLRVKSLPWKKLGNFPGSLGRYLWAERSIPVLTIELHGPELKSKHFDLESFQDQISQFASQITQNPKEVIRKTPVSSSF